MNSETSEMQEKIFEELVKIRDLLERIAREDLKRELEEVATTTERRKVWSLLDGVSGTDEIALKAGVSQRAVQIFVKDLMDADLITLEKRGYPKRKFDFVPSNWKVTSNA
jgi:hypothetical protein